MAQITRKSGLTGIVHTREIPGATPERLAQTWKFSPTGEGKHIQEVFPELSPDDREFLISGITPEEWTEAFGEDEE